MKYIQYHQTDDNKFTFPLCESVSLVFSRRLVIVSELRAMSARAIVNVAVSSGIPLQSVFAYAMFSRLGASARKVIGERVGKPEKEKGLVGGFAEMAERAMANGPRKEDGCFERLYPVTQMIRIPDNHGLPGVASLSVPGFPAIEVRDRAPVLAPISVKCVVIVKHGPGVNRRMTSPEWGKAIQTLGDAS
jgi:hypothetical protein